LGLLLIRQGLLEVIPKLESLNRLGARFAWTRRYSTCHL